MFQVSVGAEEPAQDEDEAAARPEEHGDVWDLVVMLPNPLVRSGIAEQLERRKQDAPEVFLSVPLWLGVQNAMDTQRCSIPLRRFLRRLFGEVWSAPSAFAELDSASR